MSSGLAAKPWRRTSAPQSSTASTIPSAGRPDAIPATTFAMDGGSYTVAVSNALGSVNSAAATLTTGDEALLEELYQLARRLDERMDTVERLVAADNPAFRPARVLPDRDSDNEQLRELERRLADKEGKVR